MHEGHGTAARGVSDKGSGPDTWPLRTGDLPPPSVIAREPRLAASKDNALFRLVMWRRRRAGLLVFFVSRLLSAGFVFWWLLFPYFFPHDAYWAEGLFLLGAAWFMATGGDALSGLLPFGAFASRGSGGGKGKPVRDSILRRNMTDLYLAGMQPVDFALGLWASTVTRRRFVADLAASTSLFSAAWLLVYFGRTNPIGWRWLLLPVLFGAAAKAVALAFWPFPTLARQSRIVGELAARLKFRMDPRAWRGVWGVALGRGFLLLLFALIVVVFMNYSPRPGGPSIAGVPLDVIFDLRRWGVLAAWSAGASIAGALVGFLWAIRSRRRSERVLERFCEHVGNVLEFFMALTNERAH